MAGHRKLLLLLESFCNKDLLGETHIRSLQLVSSMSSAGEESTCHAGDPGSIPGSGRSAEERIAYPFQYSWSSLVGQLVKNLPAMWETWVQSLG